MNPNPDSNQERREELTAMQALGILETEDKQALETCLQCPLSQSAQDLSAFHDTVGLLGTVGVEPQQPSDGMKARLKDKLFAELEEDSPPPTPPVGFEYVCEGEGEWMPLPSRGARVKELSNDGNTVVFLLELDPGGRVPGHTHRGREQGFVISGDLHTNDRTLQAGDYFSGAPGTMHHDLYSEAGCRAILITDKGNYPKRALQGYGALHRAVGRLRDLLTPKS